MKKHATRLEKRENKETRNPCDIQVQNHDENRTPHQLKQS